MRKTTTAEAARLRPMRVVLRTFVTPLIRVPELLLPP
jgi:hypothetical protein